MLPLNSLYEVVPVELMPEDDTNEYYVKCRYGLQQFDKRYAPIIRELGTKVYDVYLRPLPPERMEDMVKNAVYIALNLSGEGYVDREYIAKKTLEKITL